MALSAQAALLDELMGKNRNAAPGEAVRDCHFTDPDVCKHFLCGFCPHELFVNTRADLGPCDKIHDDNLKRQYEKSSRKGRLGYEEDFEQLLRSLLADVEKRIKKGRDRLSLTQGSDDKYSSARQERINALNEQINALISEADQLGREGSVDAAKEALEKCERLKIERLDLETRHTGENAKAMEVCNVCGSFLIVGDAQCRVEEHITGKQHVGFAKIRSTLEQLRANRQKAMEERMKARETEKARHLSENRRPSPERHASRHRSGSRSSRRRRHDSHHDKSPRRHSRHRHRPESRHRSRAGHHSSRSSPQRHSSEHRAVHKGNSLNNSAHTQEHNARISKPNDKEATNATNRRADRETTSRSRSGSVHRRKDSKASTAPATDSPKDPERKNRRSPQRRSNEAEVSAKDKNHGHVSKRKRNEEDDSRRRRRSSTSDDDEESGSVGEKRKCSRGKESVKQRRKTSPSDRRKSHYKSPDRHRAKDVRAPESDSGGSSERSTSSSSSESDASSASSGPRRRRARKERKRKDSSSSGSNSESMSVDKSE